MSMALRNGAEVLPVTSGAEISRPIGATGAGLPPPPVSPASGEVSASVQARDFGMAALSENRKKAVLGAVGRQAAIQVACFGAGFAVTRAVLGAGLSPIAAQGASQAAVAVVKEVCALKAGHEMKASDETHLFGMRMDTVVNILDGAIASGALAGATRGASYLIAAEMRAIRAPDAASALRTALNKAAVLTRVHGIVRAADLLHDIATAAVHAYSPGARHKYNEPAAWSSWVSLSRKEGALGFLAGTVARGITVAVGVGGATAVSHSTGGVSAAYSLQSMKQNAAGIGARALEAVSKQAFNALLGYLIPGRSRHRAIDEEMGVSEGGQPEAETTADEGLVAATAPSSASSLHALQDETAASLPAQLADEDIVQIAASIPLPPSPEPGAGGHR